MFALIVTVAGALLIAAIVIFVLKLVARFRAYAESHQYASLKDYLLAAPASEQETREAVDLAMYGFVFCLIGLAFPPFLILGAFPLFFGGRKLLYSLLGLGLADSVERSDI